MTAIKNIVLFDDHRADQILPITFTRPVAEIRIGILKIWEKWQKYTSLNTSFLTRDYLQTKFALKTEENNLLVNGAILPNKDLVEEILNLEQNQALVKGKDLIAAYATESEIKDFKAIIENDAFSKNEAIAEIEFIDYAWDIFKRNDSELRKDFELLTAGRQSQTISETNTIIGKENIFLEEGAKMEAVTINATEGPVYLGKNTEVLEGSLVRGPLALCEGASLRMGAKIYGATTIGPHSKVGGEVSNIVIQGYTNKAHDGFIGNSVLGEWVNLGADSNSSNLKNNYAEVRVWSYPDRRFVKTGTQFCGLIMGDHSKCGINTMFNTGTVVGVSANIFGDGFPRNYIPSYSWGGAQGFTEYATKKAFEVAKLVMQRRGLEFDQTEQDILTHIFEATQENRR